MLYDQYAALGYQQLTDMSASTPLVIPTGTRPRMALLQAEAEAVRWRDDGVDPTADVGMLLAAGDTLEYSGSIANIRFIAATDGAILDASLYA